MILVKLSGGLGNQMFQYAAGRSLAIKKRTKLYVDATAFESEQPGVTKRRYELDLLQIEAPLATRKQIARLVTPNLLSKAVNKMMPYYMKTFFFERSFHFDENFYRASSSCILVGYWQSVKYFEPVADVIRNEFLIKAPLSPLTSNLAERVQNTNSTSVHIRRGDYVANPETLRAHGICGLDYYGKALKELSGTAGNTELFIFSDDISWAEQNLRSDLPMTFVGHNSGDSAYEDLYLMSQCKNNIIANSSFSWWAAWLNRNDSKVVIAPSKWFNEYEANTKDLFPSGWIII